MELKVAVDGVERCISGLTEDTTCAQIIYALAHATGQKGRFVLVENFRDTERSLAPTDRPLELLRKWDEHSKYVTFVLKRLDNSSSSTTNDSFSLKSNSDSSYQNVFGGNFQQEPVLPFNPERSSSPIAKNVLNDQNANMQQATTFKPQFGKGPAPELPKSSSDASFRPVFFGLPRLPQSSENGGPVHFYSASALPQTGSLRPRPPPPSYQEVIEQRYNSLSRGATFAIPRPSIWHQNATPAADVVDAANPVAGTQDPLLNENILAINAANLSLAELERLVENQQAIIDRQKSFLLQLDTSTTDESQRELLQLERQQANLRMILLPLRSRNIPELLQKERAEIDKIRGMMIELQGKVDKTVKEISEQSLLEMKLSEQVAALEREVNDLEASSSTTDDTLDSPMREMLIS